MHLRRLILRDWKSYVDAKFDFPAPTTKKNVVLIGAKNGFGKTSFFEALVLCLFGRNGLPLIARAPFQGNDEARLQTTYNKFLEGAIHKRAIPEGRNSCSVEITFEEPQSGPIILRRVWHFTSGGQHKPQDEDIIIYEGKDERPVIVPASERGNENEWLRGYIAQQFLPYTLASFFLFDGELVQALAKRDMSSQVRLGIEGLLGIPVLRELAEDLRRYAVNRRTGQSNVSDNTIKRIEVELLELEKKRELVKDTLETLEPELASLIDQRDNLTRELGSFGSGTEALLKEKYEDLKRQQKARDDYWESLNSIVVNKLALALCGKHVHEATIKQLQQEGTRETWETGKRHVENKLDPFLKALAIGLNSIRPELEEDLQSKIADKVSEVFKTLWHPAPDGCAVSYCHPYLRGIERAQAIEFLMSIRTSSIAEIEEILTGIESCDIRIRKVDAEIAQVQGLGPQLETKSKTLRDIINKVDLLVAEKSKHQNEIDGLSSQISFKRQELGRYTKSKADAGPALRRAECADIVSDLIDKVAQEAVPGQIASVAKHMTEAFKAMAHRTFVNKVVIEPDCSVKLLSTSGRDLRDLDLSAGEQQIFAQALISSVSLVSQRHFPIVVDTPLARLDDDHRQGVLSFFTKRSGQVILLSTDTEVVGPYFQTIKDRLSKTYRLESEHDDDICKSWPVDGYFFDTEA